MSTVTFRDLGLSEPLLRALDARSYSEPTPIQALAIPHLLDGRDLLGVAQTGTGKTAAFALPILQQLADDYDEPRPSAPRVLVLTPTRELASQVGDSLVAYGKNLRIRHATVFGGVSQQNQVRALRRGVDVLVATPGRLIDLMQQGHIRFDRVEIFVLDEADRMLDMGFVRDVQRIIAKLPDERQSILFSATMPPDIVRLADRLLDDPVRVEATPPATTAERVDQRVLFVAKSDKRHLLGDLLADRDVERALVFSRTKSGANRIARHLVGLGVKADAIHGNKSQGARERALEGFKAGRTRVLVATDIAARGIDVPGVTHVINFDLPNVPESYVHRIGRTARAGREGVALSFCDVEEHEYLRDIEKLIGRRVDVVRDHAYPGPEPRPAPEPRKDTGGPRGGARRRRRRGNAGARRRR